MNMSLLAIIGIVLLIILLLAGVHIGFAMMMVGFIGYVIAVSMTGGIGMLKSVPFAQTANYSLAVIPLFVLMGQFAFASGLSQDLYDACYKFFGRIPGGLAVSTIVASAGFAAICGSSAASSATMGVVCFPEMKRYKYDDGLSTGCLAAGGTLGILIPPSVGFILYGIASGESIGALFAAGIIPGILLTCCYIAVIVIQVVKNPAKGPKGEHFTVKEKMQALVKIIPILILFVIVIGGIFIGFFTANEGGAIGAFGAMVFMLYRKWGKWKEFFHAVFEAVKTTAMIFLIVTGAYAFGYFLTVTMLPTMLASTIAGLEVPKYLILILILLVYVALGCIMDSLSMIVLLVPIFLPIAQQLGFNTIWFGVLMVMVMEMGQITPPVGINAFIIAGIAKDVPLGKVFKGLVPFILALIVAIAIILLFPQLALFIPNMLYG